MGRPRSLANVTRPHRTCYSLLMLMTRILPYRRRLSYLRRSSHRCTLPTASSYCSHIITPIVFRTYCKCRVIAVRSVGFIVRFCQLVIKWFFSICYNNLT